MALHDLLHKSDDQPEPQPTVTQKPPESNTGNEADLKAQINDQQRQIEELIAVRRDFRERLEMALDHAAGLQKKLEAAERRVEAAERRVNAEADECQRLQNIIDDADDSVVTASLKAQIENLERQVREAQAAARARDEDYRKARRERDELQAAADAGELAEPEPPKLTRFEVVICPEVPTTPEEDIVRVFKAEEVAVAQGVGHLFFYTGGKLIGGVAHNEWKTLREVPLDGEDDTDV